MEELSSDNEISGNFDGDEQCEVAKFEESSDVNDVEQEIDQNLENDEPITLHPEPCFVGKDNVTKWKKNDTTKHQNMLCQFYFTITRTKELCETKYFCQHCAKYL